MNLFSTSEDDLKAAFDLLEGNGFFKRSAAASDEYSVGGIRAWLKGKTYAEEDRGYVAATIYGAGGVHRYHVRNTGEIVFSKSHSSNWGRNYVKEAADLGFEIW